MLNFKLSPTCSAFAKDRHLWRLILGPIGCLPAETEFLTPSGWVRMDAFNSHQVAVWEPENGTVSFEVPEYVNEPFDGEFITVGDQTSTLQMVLSPAHRVPHFDWAGRFAVKTAAEIAAKPSRRLIPTTFTLNRPDAPISDDEIRVRVMFAADGSVQGGTAAVGVRKPRKVARIAELLAQTGREYKHRVTLRDGVAEHNYYFPLGDLSKDLAFVWGLSTRQLNIVLEETLHWDGLFDHVEKRFHTTKFAEAEVMQYAAHACGFRASIRTQTYPQDNWRDCYIVQWAASDTSAKNRAAWRNETPQGRVAPTDGRQYCFTTSTGYFIARHNGTVFVTGNSGKTSAVYLTLLAQALEQPVFNGKRRSRCMVIRNTRAQLKDSVIKTMLEITPSDEVNVIYRENDLSMLVRLVGDDGIPAEILFMFRSLEDESDTQRLLSVELTWVWISEFSQVDLKIAKAAVSRCGRYPSKAMNGCTHFGIVAESNFPVKDSPWYDFMEVNRPATVTVFKQPSALSADIENIENLPPGYYDNLLDGADPRWVQSYITCEYPDSLLGKAVFPGFSREFHCGKGLKPITIGADSPPLIIGLDAGRNPAAVFGQIQSSGRLNILHELWASNCAMDEFVARLLMPLINQRFGGLRVVAVLDPAGFAQGQATNLTPAKVLQDKGIYTVPASTNNIAPRLAAVDNLIMAHEGLLVDAEHCPSLVTALMRDYIFEQNKNGKVAETPTKSHPVSDLCFAAGTRVAINGGTTPIEDLRVGDFVVTPIGLRKVLAVACTDLDAQVSEYTFSNGSRLVATKDHPIYTHRGLVSIDELQYSDVLISINRNTQWEKEQLLALKSMVYGSECIPPTNTTGVGTPALRYIGIYGRKLMAMYQRVLSYITLTTILRTMRLRTWKLCYYLSTPATMPLTVRLEQSVASHTQENLLVSGMGPQRGGHGTQNMGSRRGKVGQRSSITALTAGQDIVSNKERGSVDSVLCLAKEWLGKCLAWTTTNVGVRYVGSLSHVISTPNQQKHAVSLVGKKPLVERRPVYDITVEEAHCFFADGLLVSNCDALQYLALYTTGGYAPRVGRMLRRQSENVRVVPNPRAWT